MTRSRLVMNGKYRGIVRISTKQYCSFLLVEGTHTPGWGPFWHHKGLCDVTPAEHRTWFPVNFDSFVDAFFFLTLSFLYFNIQVKCFVAAIVTEARSWISLTQQHFISPNQPDFISFCCIVFISLFVSNDKSAFCFFFVFFLNSDRLRHYRTAGCSCCAWKRFFRRLQNDQTDFFSVAVLAFQPPPCQMLPSFSSPRSISPLFHHRFDTRTQGVKLCHLSVCHTERSLAGGRGGGGEGHCKVILKWPHVALGAVVWKSFCDQPACFDSTSETYPVKLIAVREENTVWKRVFLLIILLISVLNSQRVKKKRSKYPQQLLNWPPAEMVPQMLFLRTRLSQDGWHVLLVAICS